MKFAVGSLVRARGREWVVLPAPDEIKDLLLLRPLGGSEDEITGIYTGLVDGKPFEEVSSAQFPAPDPEKDLGNYLSCSLLRDAVRLGFRSAAGPFRSLGRIAIEPRPYQLVPLLMALKLNPVRLLIADDVGIGKSVEAALIARELLDRGEIKRFTVLCPPHLGEQWQRALKDQFHIDAALILSGTAARLERTLSPGESLFDRYPFTVVSTDFIKQERRREEFLRSCPEMVLVDEAHNAAQAGARSAGQRRHELLKALVEDPSRHLLLLTATPHSGSPEAFRSLLGLLDKDLLHLPDDLSGEENRKHRERLARHLVQRRRGDITSYLSKQTDFPRREVAEAHYALDPRYRAFFQKILDFCRETVLDKAIDKRRQRIRWWSALALLRSLSSSPAAAAATLRNRAGHADAETVEAIDEEGRRTIMDLDEESQEAIDVIPGGLSEDDPESHLRKRLLSFAREVEELGRNYDGKLKQAEVVVKKLISDGFSPILFCRFIPTVEYVAEYLRKKLKGVEVEAITGALPAEEREERVEALSRHEKRVLVCTDCLSEGINLQEHFDAVVHYDLAWNPTRHEQREGRVDRYGQHREVVRALTFYGRDNPVDGIVLQVLLRKHRTIQQQLGINVPVPTDSQIVENAIMEGLLLRKEKLSDQMSFSFLSPIHKELDLTWEAAAEREKKSRALFAQHPLQKALHEELAEELAEVYRALGDDRDVERFVRTSLKSLGAVVSDGTPLTLDARECSGALKDALGEAGPLQVVFRGRVPHGALLLRRTHPLVEGLARYVLEGALDAQLEGPARRCGVIRTRGVQVRTTLLLLRLRFHLVRRDKEGKEKPLLAEDQLLCAFTGSPDKAQWLSQEEAERLLDLRPSDNIPPEIAQNQLRKILDGFPHLQEHLSQLTRQRGEALLAAHQRVRKAAKGKEQTTRLEVHEPSDILGVFVYLPDVSK